VKSKTLMCVTAMILLPRKTINSTELRSLILVVASIFFAPQFMADLGYAKSFVILSSGGSVTLRNRDIVSKATIAGATTCPGAAGCTMRLGGNTILMGRGNSTAPDQIGGDVIAGATTSQGLNCAGVTPGTTAICLGNMSSISGACVTGGGAVSAPSNCAGGTDISGKNSEVATLLPKAGPDLAAFSAFLVSLPATQTFSAINVASGGSTTITANAGLNVISVPSIVIGSGATLTISGGSSAQVVINVGSSAVPGVVTLNDSAKVLLSGGITPDRVVFNVVGDGGQFVQLGNTITFNGTILAPRQGLVLIDGATAYPTIINGALLFGLSVLIGNNVSINFYPLSSPIAKPAVIQPIGAVDVGALPAPIPGIGTSSESDEPLPGPSVEGVPGLPGISTTLFLDDVIPGLRAGPPIFTGLSNSDNGTDHGRTPPDIQLAVGTNFVVEMVNRTGAVYDKVLGSPFGKFDLSRAFGFPTNTGTDPRMVYDARSQTFFMVFERGFDATDGTDFINLAVASEPVQTGTSTVTWSWLVYPVAGNGDGICFDQPKLGVSDTMVTLSWNDYLGCPSNDPSPGSETIALLKQDLINRADVHVSYFRDSGRFGITPVQSLSQSNGVQWAVYHNTDGTDKQNLHVLAFTGTPGQDDMTYTDASYQLNPNPSVPPPALQPSGGNPLMGTPTDDTRLRSAVWRNNHLWTVLMEACRPSNGTISDLMDRSCLRLLDLVTSPICGKTACIPPELFQDITWSGLGQYLFYPAVTLDGNGDLFFGFTQSSPGGTVGATSFDPLNPSAAVGGICGGTFSSNTLMGSGVYTRGSAVYDVKNSSTNMFSPRWGDYSGAAPDPADPASAWVAQELSIGDWSTSITRVFFLAFGCM
jgi:choice-of-anchor A domain-containing protein